METDDSGINIRVAKPESIDSIWQHVSPVITRGITESQDELDARNIKQRLEDTTAILLCIFEDNDLLATAIIERIDYPSGKSVLGVISAAGERMAVWVHKLDAKLEEMAIDLDCSEVRLAGRAGWQAVLKPIGWRPIHTVLSKQVGE